jgi:hypothetical protein
MGIYPIELTADYNDDMGPITIEITNTLNEDNNNESIGIGNVQFEASSTAGEICVPVGSEDLITTGDWEHTGCHGWTEKQCGGKTYFGGYGECGKDSTISRVIQMSNYPGASKVGF